MDSKFLLPVLMAIFTSCGDPGTNANTAGTAATHGLIVPAEIAPGLLSKFNNHIALPIAGDSNYAQKHFSADKPLLTGAEVRYLNYNHVAGDMYGEDFYPDEFCSLDSLRNTPGYKINENRDATNNITVCAGGKAVINDSTSILFWVLDHTGSEGRGSFGRVILYGSLLRNNAVTSCTVLCQESSSAEAGYSANEYCVFSMNANGTAQVVTWYRTEQEDYQSGEMIITREITGVFEISISNNTWAVVEIIEDEMIFR